jgi:hypothetical protein
LVTKLVRPEGNITGDGSLSPTVVAGARYIRKKQAILGDFVFAA